MARQAASGCPHLNCRRTSDADADAAAAAAAAGAASGEAVLDLEQSTENNHQRIAI